MVAFIWQPWNTEHLARHGATPELAEAGSSAMFIRVKMGRPRKTEPAAPSVVKAVRLPVGLLISLQDAARQQGLSLNAVFQMASAEWLTHHK